MRRRALSAAAAASLSVLLAQASVRWPQNLPPQDRHASSSRWPDDPLGRVRRATATQTPLVQFPDKEIVQPQVSCHIASHPETLRIIRENVARRPCIRPDRGHRSPLLPVHRRQDRQIPCKDPAPVLPGTRSLNTHEVYVNGMFHIAAHGSAVADCALHSRSKR